MKPLVHAIISQKKYGGIVEDYMPIHNFFDTSKAALPDVRHRAVLHSAFGIFVLERVFGDYITNSDGVKVSVRDLGEEHVLQDMGFIPTVERWFRNMPIEDWMMGRAKKSSFKRVVDFNSTEEDMLANLNLTIDKRSVID